MRRHGFATVAAAALAVSGGTSVVTVGLSGPAAAATSRPGALENPAATPRQKADAAKAARHSLASHRAAVKGTDGDAYTMRSVLVDRDGTAHARFDSTYKGLPVIGGDIVEHLAPGGVFKAAETALGRPLSLSTTPGISAKTATAVANRTFRGHRSRTLAPKLTVDARTRSAKLTWDTEVRGVRPDQTPSRLHVLIDARTGKVVDTHDEVETVDGTGKGLYVGAVTLSTTQSGSSYQMVDPTHGNGTTTNLDHPTSGEGRTFTDADNAWGDGTTGDPASAAVDAAYGAAKTFDYYKNVQGRNGIWNNGTGARSRVHYGNAYENAFWDGTQMSYGDGTNNAKPLIALDIAGHEMSHGVTENTAALGYSGDAGGLNEANSDIFGTMVEFYANNPNDTPDYDIGEKIDLFGTGKPLRYMYNPSLDGKSPNCWSSSVSGLDPHYSSGPGNHVFYLLAVGSSNSQGYPTSPTCNNSTVTGIGNDKASKIWYKALSAYMVSTETYPRARDDLLKAATDLYGKCNTEYKAVQAAFSAINVTGTDQSCGSNPPPVRGRYFENTDDVDIPDAGAAVYSDVDVTGVTGNAPATLKVGVDIVHTYIGDLGIDLVGPSDRTYRLKAAGTGGSADDLHTTYTVDASAETADGRWRLKVQDHDAIDTGHIDRFSLQF